MLERSMLRELQRRIARADDGQDLAEYAILIGLIALVVVGAVTLFGGQLTAMYDSIVSTLPFN
jgi:pilus assembly protein Flp/PilA